MILHVKISILGMKRQCAVKLSIITEEENVIIENEVKKMVKVTP